MVFLQYESWDAFSDFANWSSSFDNIGNHIVWSKDFSEIKHFTSMRNSISVELQKYYNSTKSLCLLVMWDFNWSLRCEEYSQNWQRNGLTPVWVSICLLMFRKDFAISGQYGQPNCVGPMTMRLFLKDFGRRNM